MTFEIRTDTEYKCFEIVCKNKKCLDYPGGFNVNSWGTGYWLPIKGNWYKAMEDLASWVNNELKEECLFCLG